MFYQSPSRGDNKTVNNGQMQQTSIYQQYAAFNYPHQLISAPFQFEQQQQHSPTTCIKNSVVNRQMMKHQRSPYYSKEHLHRFTSHKQHNHDISNTNYFSNLSSPSSSVLSASGSRHMIDSGLHMSYSTSSPDISKTNHLLPPGYDPNLNGSGLSTSSSSVFSESNMMGNPPTTPVSTSLSSSNNSHTSSETPPPTSTVFQQRVEILRQDILSIPSSSSSVSGKENQKLYVTPATTTSPSNNSDSKASSSGLTSLANTCLTSVKSSLDSSYDDLKSDGAAGSGFVSSGSYSGAMTPGSYSDIPDSPTQMKHLYPQPQMPIPTHMGVSGYFQSPGGRLYAWQQPIDSSTLRPKQQTSLPASQLDDISYTVDSSCSKSNDITIMERTLQMGNISSHSNSHSQSHHQPQSSLSHHNSWSFQTALSTQSGNNTNHFVEADGDNESLKHYNDDDQSDTKSVRSNFSGYSVISDIARDQAQYASVDSDALENMVSFCRQRSANNSALPTPNMNRQQAPVLTSSANKPPWAVAPIMGSSIRSIFSNQEVNHTPPSKDVENEMPWRNQSQYQNVNRALFYNQAAGDDLDKDALRSYDHDDVDDTKSVTYSIPSIIHNEQEAIKSRPPIDVDSLIRNAKQSYNPVFEASNSMNWTMLNNNSGYHYNHSNHQNNEVPAPFLPKNDIPADESMNNQSSFAENSTLDDDDEQMNEFIQQNYYDESSEDEESDDEYYDDSCGQIPPFESSAQPSRPLLPKIEEVQEEEDYSPKQPTKKAVRKNPPVIQMNKTALLRVNKMKEMAAASKNATESSGVRRATSTSQNLASGVKENATKTISKPVGKTGNKINPIRRTIESSAQQQVLASTNLHSSKYNKY